MSDTTFLVTSDALSEIISYIDNISTVSLAGVNRSFYAVVINIKTREWYDRACQLRMKRRSPLVKDDDDLDTFLFSAALLNDRPLIRSTLESVIDPSDATIRSILQGAAQYNSIDLFKEYYDGSRERLACCSYVGRHSSEATIDIALELTKDPENLCRGRSYIAEGLIASGRFELAEKYLVQPVLYQYIALNCYKAETVLWWNNWTESHSAPSNGGISLFRLLSAPDITCDQLAFALDNSQHQDGYRLVEFSLLAASVPLVISYLAHRYNIGVRDLNHDNVHDYNSVGLEWVLSQVTLSDRQVESIDFAGREKLIQYLTDAQQRSANSRIEAVV
jgi:hypothetical protein